MKKTNFAILILGLVVLFNNETAFSQEIEQTSPKTEQKQCNALNDELEFCLESSFISVNSGEAVVLHYSVKNLTEKQIIILRGGRGIGRLLKLTITDESGNKIPTILETLTKKLINNERFSEEESKKYGIVTRGSGPLSSDFEPNEETKWSWNLSYSYEFRDKSKYFIEIKKIEFKEGKFVNTETLLGKVEVEIK